MCGISGVLTSRIYNDNWYGNNLKNFSKILQHRGPDSDGIWYDVNDNIGLSHSRLSILELTNLGHQPMMSKSNRYIISFNGEIYNHISLREELIRNKSINWSGNSDTETLIESIDFFGLDKTLEKIDGMFAFAFWDRRDKVLYLARDSFGEKPLYFGWVDSNFVFSSELNVISSISNNSLDISKKSLDSLFRFSYVPSPSTIYKNIYKLEAGYYLKINKNNKTYNLNINKNSQIFEKNLIIKKWFNLKKIYQNKHLDKINNYDSAKIELKKRLFNSVESRMISDVEIGSLLSGGIDSSLVTAIMSKISNKKIKSFNMAFNSRDYDESFTANEIAKHLSTDHHTLNITENQLIETSSYLSDIYSEPFADSSQIPTYLLTKNVSKYMKVVLSGDGGDELFGGYNRYIWSTNIWSKIKLLPLKYRKFIAKIMLKTPDVFLKLFKFIVNNMLNKNIDNFSDKYFKLANKISWVKNKDDFFRSLVTELSPNETLIKNFIYEDDLFNNLDIPDYLNENFEEKMMYIDILTYLCDDILCKVDRASMSNSLEVRVPFLSKDLLDLSVSIPTSMKISHNINKKILRDVAYELIPSEILNKPKKGFGVPLKNWLKDGPLHLWAENLINHKLDKVDHLISSNKIKKMWSEHLSNKRDWQNNLWPVLIFLSWYKI
jgi:asparagine synthase (glutamine-hydrolysing)